MTHSFSQKLGAEFIGTAGLLATVIGSGIMGEALAGGNVAIALLGNTIATGAMLVVLIWVFGPISGAHFNPAVTIAFALRGEISPRDSASYILVQVLGGLVGMIVAHLMFDLSLLQESTKVRTGLGQWAAEGVATLGLVATILGCLRARPDAVAMAVGLYITAGYWFTASTSFANPAVTVARSFTDTFSGIQPGDAPAFIGMQFAGAVLAVLVMRWLWRDAD
tara:strand:- start:311 stop:976 length:666 start_codon:yes stop_codon:yes gene_type:complete